MSFAAGVLTAALALPPQGLIAAYDFARTNFVNWSEDLTQSGWTRAGAVATSVQAVLADGAVGPVTRLVDNTANAQHLVASSVFTPADNTAQSFVWRLKAAEYRYVGVQWANKAATAFPTNIVDLQDGVILNGATGASVGTTFTGTSGGLGYTVTVAPAGNGWYDVTVNVPSVGAGTNSPRPALLLNNAATNTNGYVFAGTGTSGILIQRVQWNATVAPLPYERTTDGQTLIDRSVRLWPAPAGRINLLNWTEDFTQSVWGKSGLTLTDPSINDPLTGAKAWRVNSSGADPYVFQFVSGNPSGLTVTYSVRVKMEGSVTGRSFRFYSYGSSSTEAIVSSGFTAATGDWQTLTFTRTYPAGMTSTSHVFRIDTPENGAVAGDTVLVAAPMLNYGASALHYEKQTDGLTYDLSLKGKNLLPASETFGLLTDTYFTAVRANGSVTLSVNNTGASTIATTRQWFGSAGSAAQVGIPVQPGRTYTLSGVIETSGNANVTYHFGMHVFRGGAYLAEPGPSLSGNAARTRVSATYTVPLDGGIYTVSPRLAVYNVLAGAVSTVTLSQVQLEEGPVPTYYERSAAHAALGSTAGTADSSDPTWGPTGMTFDGVDDGIQGGSFAVPDGDFTLLVAFTTLVDSGTSDGKAITRTAAGGVSNSWRTNVYIGPVTNFGMNVKVGIYHVTGGFSNSGFTYLNFPGSLTVGQPRVAVVRVSGLTVRSMYLLAGGVPSATLTLPIPQAPLGGIFQGFGTTANVVMHAFGVWTRALTDAEVTQAYRATRNQLSKRGVTI